jgi:transcriptional regulator with XRE-family HTH domain
VPIVITARQIRAARALTGLGQQELADRARVGVATIRRIEAAADEITGSARSMARIEHALEAAGVIFIDQDETAGPGVRLRRPSR